jgi:hypothetical protein
VTGSLPFSGNNYPEILRRIGEDEPEPIVAHGVADFELWEILRRGLAKSPEERWPSMQALGQALAKWLKDRGVRDDVSGVLLESRWLAKCRSEPATWHESTDPSSTVRPVRGRAKGPNGVMKRRLGRTMIVATAATAILAALVGWSAANEKAETREAVASDTPLSKAPAKAEAVAPPALPIEPATLRTVADSKPAPRSLSAPKTAATQAMPDGGVPKRRVRRVPNDLLYPY